MPLVILRHHAMPYGVFCQLQQHYDVGVSIIDSSFNSFHTRFFYHLFLMRPLSFPADFQTKPDSIDWARARGDVCERENAEGLGLSVTLKTYVWGFPLGFRVFLKSSFLGGLELWGNGVVVFHKRFR